MQTFENGHLLFLYVLVIIILYIHSICAISEAVCPSFGWQTGPWDVQTETRDVWCQLQGLYFINLMFKHMISIDRFDVCQICTSVLLKTKSFRQIMYIRYSNKASV